MSDDQKHARLNKYLSYAAGAFSLAIILNVASAYGVFDKINAAPSQPNKADAIKAAVGKRNLPFDEASTQRAVFENAVQYDKCDAQVSEFNAECHQIVQEMALVQK